MIKYFKIEIVLESFDKLSKGRLRILKAVTFDSESHFFWSRILIYNNIILIVDPKSIPMNLFADGFEANINGQFLRQIRCYCYWNNLILLKIFRTQMHTNESSIKRIH